MKLLLNTAFILTFVLSVLTKTTDADLVDRDTIPHNTWIAATLDFSHRSTANNSPVIRLFNVSGLQPGGFQIKAVRVKNDGKLNLKYQLYAVKTAGDDNFCNALEMTVMKDWERRYEDSLTNLSLASEMDADGKDDWVIIISLNDGDSSLANKFCDFNLVFKTDSLGFSDDEILENHISSGSWVSAGTNP